MKWPTDPSPLALIAGAALVLVVVLFVVVSLALDVLA